MQIKIIRVTVVLRDATDIIYVHTDLPSPVPNVSPEAPSLSFVAQYDTGVAYVRTNFGVEPEVINSRS
jgi:hypothetical protein